MRLAWVAVPVPALDLLTYVVPPCFDLPAVGARVLVPLASRRVTGLVVRTADEAGETPSAVPDLKPILDVIDDDAFLPAHIVELGTWVADYYACGPGDALAAAMPPFAWIESEQAVRITEKGRAVLEAAGAKADSTTDTIAGFLEQAPATSDSHAGTIALLRALARADTVPVRVLAQKLGGRGGATPTSALRSLLRSFEGEGLVETTTALRGRGTAFKTTKVAAITAAGHEVAASAGAAPRGVGERQREALQILQGTPEGLPFAILRDRGVTPDTVRRLAARGLVVVRTIRVERDPFAEAVSAGGGLAPPSPGAEQLQTARTLSAAARVLTGEQSAALDRLHALAAGQQFAVALLHGVTGSGKTEVYLRLAQDVVRSNRSALVLVPEIALTPALVSLFRDAFGDRVAVQHSGLSDGERHDQWHRIRRGEISVVIGTRSAVFAPLSGLGLVVVDEEHDGSYKQEESPRYHGRDVAIVRGSRDGALVVLGSATPAMESYQHALNGRYEHLVLARRVLDRPLASVRIVNMRDEYAQRGPDVVFSETLQLAIEERMVRGEQVLVLLNRRGFATTVFCRQCGNTIDCPNCSVSLTIHGRHTRRARCHYCNYSMLAPKTCPACAAPYLEQAGIGTEKLEDETARLFPGARLARLDRDVASRRGAMVALLSRFAAHEIDILIGTQMIAKGHDFPLVTLVGIISADVGLGLPDFRASERTFQLLTQVVGRAGRGERPGEAIIQTLYPDHYSVRLACRQDYPGFFEEEIRFRRSMHYPPDVSLVNAVVRGPTFQAAMEDASDLVKRVRASAEGQFRVLGPAPAALVKLRGEHRAQFFVKGSRRSAMRQAVQAAIAARPDLRRRVTIDVDPLTVL